MKLWLFFVILSILCWAFVGFYPILFLPGMIFLFIAYYFGIKSNLKTKKFLEEQDANALEGEQDG